MTVIDHSYSHEFGVFDRSWELSAQYSFKEENLSRPLIELSYYVVVSVTKPFGLIKQKQYKKLKYRGQKPKQNKTGL